MKTFKKLRSEINEGGFSKSKEALHLNLDDWKSHAKKLGYKISKSDDGSHHATKNGTHKGSFFTQSAITGGFMREE